MCEIQTEFSRYLRIFSFLARNTLKQIIYLKTASIMVSKTNFGSYLFLVSYKVCENFIWLRNYFVQRSEQQQIPSAQAHIVFLSTSISVLKVF